MKTHTELRRIAYVFIFGCALMGASSSMAQKPASQAGNKNNPQIKLPQASPEDVAAVGEYNKRIAECVKLHKSLESKLGALPAKAEPEVITAHQKQLAAAIQAARQGAQPGDIFSPAETYFRRMITANLRKDGDAKKTVLTEGNPRGPEAAPTEAVKVAVNAVYPDKAPVSTIPPLLLLRLPPLPKELNYRFVGRHLILHDVRANLIVDYLLNVVP